MAQGEEHSIYETVMEAAQRDFLGNHFANGELTRVVDWLLVHRNTGGGFVFPLTLEERRARLPLLSGEKPKTFLLAENALECESLRLLVKGAPGNIEAAQITAAADRRLSRQCFASVCTTGECPHVSIAYLRFQAARNVPGKMDLLEHGVEIINQHRSGDGRWKKFPFWYTLLWLLELPDEMASEELAYTSPAVLRAREAGFTGPGAAVRERIVRLVLN